MAEKRLPFRAKSVLHFFKSAVAFIVLAVLLLSSASPAFASVNVTFLQKFSQNQSVQFFKDSTQNFAWGVLAMNPSKDVYKTGEMAHFAMGVLDEKGAMVCDAKVELLVVNKFGNGYKLTTENGGVVVNQECTVKNYTNKPDFESGLRFREEGQYQLVLTAETKKGKHTIYDTVTVSNEQQPFEIKRYAPTRIFPLAQYPVHIDVVANQDFSGTVEEVLPAGFRVMGEPSSFYGSWEDELWRSASSDSVSYEAPPKVFTEEGKQKIQFPLHLKKGEQATLLYTLDAPDISPQFYLVDTLQFSSNSGQKYFAESREWQFANDLLPVRQIFITTGSSWAVPVDWNSASNTIETIGGGGGGGAGAGIGNGGGAGGGYSKSTNVVLTPGATVNYSVASNTAAAATAGADSFFCNSTSNCVTIAGSAVVVGSKGGTAGGTGSGATTTAVATTTFVGDSNLVKFSGGNGGAGYNTGDGGGGGGGAAGPSGAGKAGGGAGGVNATDGGGGGGGSNAGSATIGANGTINGGNGGAGTGGTGGGGGGTSANGTAGTNGTGGGGGGGDGDAVRTGGAGATSTTWSTAAVTLGEGGGPGGGGGGTGNAGNGGAGGKYGGGGGGGEGTGGTGAPGIIVITYTPRTITVSGNVYSNEGVTGLTNSRTIKMVVTNSGATASTTYSSSTIASTGRYDFFDVTTSPSSIYSIFLDGATEDAATVVIGTATPANLSGISLYQDYAILNHSTTTANQATATNANMGVFDGDNDADIPFTANSNNLLLNSNTNFYIWPATILDPGGTVTTQGTGNLIVATTSAAFLNITGNTLANDAKVYGGATLYIDANTTVSGGDITLQSTGTLRRWGGTPTLTISGTGTIGGGTGDAVIYNLTISGSGTISVNASTTVLGDVSVGTGATMNGTGSTTILGGDLTGDGAINKTGGTVEIQGAGYFGGNTAWTFYNLNIGNGTNDSATSSGTGAITVTNVLNVSEGSILNAGAKTWNLTGAGNPLVTLGWLVASTSTFSFQGSSTTTVPGGTYYNLDLSPVSGNTSYPIGSGFFTATSTGQTDIYDLVIDSVNGNMYAGTGANGIILKCVLSTGCTSWTDWVLATDTPEVHIVGLAIDSVNGAIYAGSSPNAIIYKCMLSTGCASAGNWVTATDTPEATVYTFGIDSVNGNIYAGTNSNGIIYKCLLSTGCTSATNWVTASDTPQTHTTSFAVYSSSTDSSSSAIFAGTAVNGIILKCLLSTGCTSIGSWKMATDTPESFVYSLAIDNTNGAIYAGTGQVNGIIYKCLLSTGCVSAGNWTVATDTPENSVLSLSIDNSRGIIYAGTGGAADTGTLYKCILSTGCSSDGNWTLVADTYQDEIQSLVVDSSSGSLYAGGNNILYKSRFSLDTTNNFSLGGVGSVTADASTNSIDMRATGNFTIGSGDTFSAGATTTVAGDWTNSGTFTHNNGTVFFSSTSSGKTIYASTSPFYNLSFNQPGGGWTLQDRLNASGTVQILAGVVRASGTTITLSATGSPLLVSGTFVASSSTVSFAATSGTTTIPALSYYNLSLSAATGSPVFQLRGLASTTLNTAIPDDLLVSLAVDAVNGVVYAGAGGNGKIYKCTLSTGCGSGGNWALATTTQESSVSALTIDSVNGAIYGGSDVTGIIYKCILSTGCTSAGNWIAATDTPANAILAMAVDSQYGAIYAGGGNTGIIYKCILSTGCTSTTNWTVATDTPAGYIETFAVDTVNGAIYTGTDQGIIYKCILSTGCTSTTNWTVATTTGASTIYSLTVDDVNGGVYAGGSGKIYKCILSTGCASAGSWTLATASSESSIPALKVSPNSGEIYAGGSDTGNIYKCILSTGCTSAGSWTVATTTSAVSIISFALDPNNGGVFVGVYPGADVYELKTNFSVANNLNMSGAATQSLDVNTNDPALNVGGTLTIGSGNTFLASNLSTTTVGGNLTINGTFTHNNGTLQFNTSTATSTITSAANTSFYDLVVNSPGKALVFQKHTANVPTFTISGQMVLRGTVGNLISVLSDTVGSQWLVSFGSTQTNMSYVFVKNSGCLGSVGSVSDTSTLTNGGNNGTCWFVVVAQGGGISGPTQGVDGGSGGGTTQTGGGSGGGSSGTGGGDGGGSTQGGGGQGGGGGGGAP